MVLNMLDKRSGESLQAEGRIGEIPCLMSTDSEASVTIDRHDVTV
jgi:hypothetical protein